MKFNFSKTKDFPPEVTIDGFRENIQVVSQARLVGVIISDDLKQEHNTKFICTKAYSNLWMLRRLKQLNVDTAKILDVYMKEVRSLVELAVPAWHGLLTKSQSADVERVQRVAV